MFGSKTNAPAPAPSTPEPASQPPPPRPAAFSAPHTHNDAQSSARNGAVLSQGVSINGDVKFGSELLIDGEVTGTITSTGALTIGEHGRVKADIKAGSVTILGRVDGDVVASERCVLEAGGTLRGDVESPRLALNENASFSGSAKISAKKS